MKVDPLKDLEAMKSFRDQICASLIAQFQKEVLFYNIGISSFTIGISSNFYKRDVLRDLLWVIILQFSCNQDSI